MSPLKELRKLFRELMNWQEEELMPVDFVMASYLSAFLPGAVEKSWGDLCGPASIGKTEILRALEDGQRRTVVIHNVTENAFSSAMRDEDDKERDFSLAYQLSNGRPPKGPKVLVLPELSTFLTMKGDKVNKFFGDLRAAFDGSYNNAAGNIGLDNKGDLNFGLLTACTEVLDEFRKVNQTLGERTVVCRIGRHTSGYASRQRIADHVGRGNRLQKAELRARIKVVTGKALDSSIARIRTTGGRVQQDDSLIHKVGRLAAVATSVRTHPLSANSYTSLAEGPGRLTQQLITWGDCRVLFDGRDSWTKEDYNLVRRIAQDTMPPESLRVLNVMWRGGREESMSPMRGEDIRKQANIDSSFYRQLRQWAIIGIMNRFEEDSYGLNTEFAEDVHNTGFMEGL